MRHMKKESKRTATVREPYAKTVGCSKSARSRRLTWPFARPPLASRTRGHRQVGGRVRLFFRRPVP